MIRPQVKHALLPLLCELLSVQEGYMLANYLLLKLGMKPTNFFYGEASQEVLDLVLETMQGDSEVFVPVNEARPRYDDVIGATQRDMDGLRGLHVNNLEWMAQMHGEVPANEVPRVAPPLPGDATVETFTAPTAAAARGVPTTARELPTERELRAEANRLRGWQDVARTVNAVTQRTTPVLTNIWMDEAMQNMTREEEMARGREILDRVTRATRPLGGAT